MRSARQQRYRCGRTFVRVALVMAPLLGLAACSFISPHVFSEDNKQLNYAYTRKAEVAEFLPESGTQTLVSDYYGTLPAAIDATDTLRLKYLQAFNREASVPRLLELTLVPGAAYSMYRLATGSGPDMRKEILRNGLAGATALTVAKTLSSPPRQQLRLAAVEALSCAIQASSTRYLYLKTEIEGAPLGLIPARNAVPAAQQALLALQDEGQALYDTLPRQLKSTVAPKGACAKPENRNSPQCKARGEDKDAQVSADNPAVAELKAALAQNEKALKQVDSVMGQSKSLLSRIQGAGNTLTEVRMMTEVKVAGAIETLQPDPAAIQASVLSLAQTVSALKAGFTPVSTPATDTPATTGSGDDKTATGQSGQKAGAAAKAAAGSREEGAQELAKIQPLLEKMRNARMHVAASLTPLRGFLAEDRSRARDARALGDCSVSNPTVRLELTPEQEQVNLVAGEILSIEADGGSEMPRVSMGGATRLQASALQLVPDVSDPKRLRVRAVLTVPESAVAQNVQLTFRNGDALEQKMTVAISAKEASPPKSDAAGTRNDTSATPGTSTK